MKDSTYKKWLESPMLFKHLDLVSYAVAKQMRDIGFNDRCLVSYDLDKRKYEIDFQNEIKADRIPLEGVLEVKNEYFVEDFANFVAVPTKYQVMTWFKERGYFGETRVIWGEDGKPLMYEYIIFKDGKELYRDVTIENHFVIDIYLIFKLIEIYNANESNNKF